MITYCAVPGCSSNSRDTDYTFHRFPRNVITRARWLLALQRPIKSLNRDARVCGLHFERRMARSGTTKTLVPSAVPTLSLPPRKSTPLIRNQETDTAMEELDDDSDDSLLETEFTDLMENKKESIPLPNRETDTTLKAPLLHGTKSTKLQTKLPTAAKTRPGKTKFPNIKVSRDEIIACRVCLAADVRLFAMSSSGLEDMLAAITGIKLPIVEGWPHHLCVFCVAKLSKCIAFRDSYQRSTKLLQSLLEKGPLTMTDIRTVDRQTHKLTNGLAQAKIYNFQTNSILETIILSKNQRDDSNIVPDYTEIEYLESEDGAENLQVNKLEERNSIDTHEIKVEIIEEEPLNGNSDADLDIDDEDYALENDSDTSEESVKLGKKSSKHENNDKNKKDDVKQYPTDIDSDTSEETIEMRKMVKMKKLLRNKSSAVTKENPTDSVINFERDYNCTIKVLSKEEQIKEVEERKRNNTSEYCCDFCGKGYKNENTMRTHLRYHNPILPHECDVCRLRFRSRHKMVKHRRFHRTAITCNECGFVNRTRWNARHHFLMHKGTDVYACPYCPAEYNHNTSYFNHIRMQHPGENEPCDECGETFAAGRGLQMHKTLMHSTDDNSTAYFKCKACDVTFVNAKALKKHEELGAGVPHAALWACATCGDSTGSEVALAAHAAEHQKERHHCDECNKTFLNRASFDLHVQRKHMNRRAAEAPFRRKPRGAGRSAGRSEPCVCHVCGKMVQNSSLLQYHMNAHLDIKPFRCHLCPKTFSFKGNLNLHLRVHTGERPFQCEKCPLAFASQGNFSRHVKYIHAEQRILINCDMCGKLISPASLGSHIRAIHMNQPYVRRKRTRTKPKPALVTES